MPQKGGPARRDGPGTEPAFPDAERIAEIAVPGKRRGKDEHAAAEMGCTGLLRLEQASDLPRPLAGKNNSVFLQRFYAGPIFDFTPEKYKVFGHA